MQSDEERLAELDRQLEAAADPDAASAEDFDDLVEQRAEINERIARSRPPAAPAPTPTPTASAPAPKPTEPAPVEKTAAELVREKIDADWKASHGDRPAGSMGSKIYSPEETAAAMKAADARRGNKPPGRIA